MKAYVTLLPQTISCLLNSTAVSVSTLQPLDLDSILNHLDSHSNDLKNGIYSFGTKGGLNNQLLWNSQTNILAHCQKETLTAITN